MFNVGGGEILVIAVIALIVLGPQRLPDAARQVGKAMGEMRRLSSGFQSELRSAFDDAEKGVSAGPRRDVLGVGTASTADTAPTDGPTGPAAASDGRRPRRRTPLRAGPVPDTPPPRTKGP